VKAAIVDLARAAHEFMSGPQVPEHAVEIRVAPEAERRLLLDSMRRYDAIGRRMWRGWLGDGAVTDSEGLPAAVSGRRTRLAPAALEA